MDRWNSSAIQCGGGLILNLDTLTQAIQFPGSARILQNYEPAIEGGYRRISGYIKYDSNVVTGGTNNPVLGLKVALNGVFACRKDSGGTDNAIYFSTGTGWTKVNTTLRPGTVSKARFIAYSITQPVVIQCDGVNYAWKWNGTTEATLNTSGAPTNPKYAALFRNRLVLSGYGDGSKVTLSAPNNDEDFTGGSDAIELNIGDTVVGLRTFRDELYIFCERSIKKLSGSTSADFAVVEVAKSIGCVSGDTIQEIGGDLIYLSLDGFRSVAATERIGDVELGLLSKQIQPLVRDLLGNRFSVDVYSGITIRGKSQYRLFVNDVNSTEDDNGGFIGKLVGRAEGLNYEWATLRGIQPYCADSEYTDNQEIAVIGHPTNGYVYLLEAGNTFDGRLINAVYRSPDLPFTEIQNSDSSIRKVFQKLNVYTQIEGDVEFTMALKLDREISGVLQPDIIMFSQTGSVPTYGTGIYDTSIYGELTYPIFNTNLIGSGFTAAFLFSSVNDKAPHRIDSLQIQLGVKGRR